MDGKGKATVQIVSLWCGIAYMLAILLGWALFAGFLPPPSAGFDAEQIATIYKENNFGIRVGMIFILVSAFLFIPFTAVFTQAVARIEGRPGPLAYSALMGGFSNVILTFYPAIWWMTAAFRQDRPAELILLMNDMSWLQWLGGLTVLLGMQFAIIFSAFLDKSSTPTFPCWFGYFNVCAVLAMLPDQLLFFFHTGPFSWTGLFGLWLPAGMFFLWFLLTFYLLRAAILRDRMAQALASGGSEVALANSVVT